MVEIYIGNTDNRWFDYLRSRQPWQEVNFWKPTPATFKAIDEGGIFAFRLKSPRAKIGGFGILASAINVSIQFAWDGLGNANGCEKLSDLVESIRKYRGGRDITAQSLFGCRVLLDPIFFAESEWFDVPDDWSDNIVSGKTYNTRSRHGEDLWHRLSERANAKPILPGLIERYGIYEPADTFETATESEERLCIVFLFKSTSSRTDQH